MIQTGCKEFKRVKIISFIENKRRHYMKTVKKLMMLAVAVKDMPKAKAFYSNEHYPLYLS